MIHRDRNLSGHWGRTEAGWGRPRRGGLQTHLLLVKVPDVRTAWPWHDRSRKVGHNVLESSVLVRRLALDHQRRVLDQHYKTFFAAPSYHRPSVFFIKPHSHPNGFYWVTNSHGPLPQPTSCSLKTATGSNHKPNSPVWGGWGSKSGPNIKGMSLHLYSPWKITPIFSIFWSLGPRKEYSLTYFITVRLACLTSLDSYRQVNLLLIQHKQVAESKVIL